MRRRVIETAASSYHNRVVEKGAAGLGCDWRVFQGHFSVAHFNTHRRNGTVYDNISMGRWLDEESSDQNRHCGATERGGPLQLPGDSAPMAISIFGPDSGFMVVAFLVLDFTTVWALG